jgi:cytochrome c556
MRIISRAVIAATCLTVFAGVALAQDPIGARKAAMKKNGAAVASLVKMSRGADPYDAAKAKAAVQDIIVDLKGFDALFPAGSDKGDTKATAKIWEDMAGFKAALAKAEAAAAANVETVGKDVDGVKAAIGAITATCNGCHEAYRKS